MKLFWKVNISIVKFIVCHSQKKWEINYIMEFSWDNVLRNIEGRISKPSYETWIKNTKAEISEDIVTVFAPNSFARDWLGSKYEGMILEVVKELAGKTYQATFVVEGEREDICFKGSYLESADAYNLMKKQQEKIDELEKRIQVLEQKLEV